MAFFGAKQQPVEQGALDALNCAAALRGMLGNLIESRYPKLGADALGIRIGIDYGPRERVLWASYGYPGMHEVTATSYHVDVAAKLQQCAPRNQIMVGQSLRDLLDIPEELLRVKQVTRDGEDAPEPYVLPNYAGKDGRPVDYRKHIFRWAEYLRCTRIAEVAPEIVSRSEPPFRVSIGYADVRDPTAATMPYFPGGSMLPKDKELKFSIELPLQPRVPIAIDLDVENHGKEASAAENSGNHSTRVEKTRIGDLSLIHWEGTRYRGLHYLDVVANSHGKRHCASRLGIWIA